MPRFPVLMLLVFALTLFSSATLLFMVEPMIGKMILPLLGGTPAVWNTCMVFFQAILLLGYGYAHLSTSWLGPRKQAVLHLVLLAVPFLFFPLVVNRGLIKGDENPIPSLLLVLSLSVGMPMFVVSASAPLLQKWFASTSHPAARDPYFLYGASNLGSMLALLAYPTVVEPYLRLAQQSLDWSIGYAILAALTAICAVFLWLSPRDVEISEKTEAAPAEEPRTSGDRSLEAIRPRKQGIRAGQKHPEPNALIDDLTSHTLTGAVTWKRVLRWVALAFVPSSLMLGATTYITTDIAAIPLLWVAPLALYLLSFILVFSKPWFQRLTLAFACVAISFLLGFLLWELGTSSSRSIIRWLFRILTFLCAGGAYGAWWSWKTRDNNVLHRVMVLVMPLLVLLLLFFMLAEPKIGIAWRLGLHLMTLFVVSMVCHGELARDRPAPKYLTGYFLWMSVGGVLGGLFNGLIAPVVFNGIIEYELAMLLACFLAPTLGITQESSWGRRIDMMLAGLFVGIGGFLLVLWLRDHAIPYDVLVGGPWPWELAALVLGLLIGIVAALRARDKRLDHWLDLVLPATLGLLLIGLSWGLGTEAVSLRVDKVASNLGFDPGWFRRILVYGVPILMCYTFIERPLRFTLGIGAILLTSTFCSLLNENVLHQERSFFGVLKVEKDWERYGDGREDSRRLVHGTTLHGVQFLSDRLREQPLTYYHRSGPIGQVMEVYNRDNRRNLAVIGLGTGTMACYARPGQHLTFYDIDPVVRRLSFDEEKPFFTYVGDARKRGARLELVMGDARLTMERKQLKDSEKYGIIVVDAFSSDAIPIHLITLQAMDVYLDKLTEDGLLAFHISNRYLDLRPVLANLAKERGLTAVYQSDDKAKAYPGKLSSNWVVLARKSAYLDGLRGLNDWEDEREQLQRELLPLALWPDNGSGLAAQARFLRAVLNEPICTRSSKWRELQPEEDENWPDLKKVGVWTDDYSNLLSVFWW